MVDMLCPCCFSSKNKNFGIYEDMILLKCENCGIIFQPKHSKALKNLEIINEIYSKYSKNLDLHIKINREKIEKIEKTFKRKLENLDILEVGVGNGALAYLLSPRNNYIGFEPYSIFWKQIDNLNLSNRVYKTTFKKEIIMGKKFDVIIANDVIEHLYNPSEMLIEFKSFLKQDGFIWLEVPDESYIRIKGMIRILLSTYIKKYPTNPDHKILFTNETFLSFLKNLGFSILYYEMSSVWGDERKIEIACSNKFYPFLKIISKILRITKIDLIIGGNITVALR